MESVMKPLKSPVKAVALATMFVLIGGALSPTAVHASTVDINSTAIAFANGTGDPAIGRNAAVGFSHRYNNVVTVGGVSVDAIVSVISATGIDSDDDHASGANNLLDELDDNGLPGAAIRTRLDIFGLDNQSADPNFQGETVIRVAFMQSGTQNSTTLQNVVINVKDIDSLQFVEFAAISSYKLTNNTEISVATNTSAPSLVTAGSTRFFEPNGNPSDNIDEENWVQVSYNQLSFVDIKVGARQSGSAYYGIEFSAATFTAATATVNVAAPAYTVSYNNNGSSNATPSSTTASGAITTAAAPSRNGFTFAGWNTSVDGTGIAIAAESSLTPSANITLFAQWTAAVTTTTTATAAAVAPTTTAATAVAPTTTAAPMQEDAVRTASLPATGSDDSQRLLAMMGLWLVAIGGASRLVRRTSR